MRFGVKVGPFYASTGTRRRRRGGGNSIASLMFGLMIMVGILFWPLMVAHSGSGRFYWWGWVSLVAWWLALMIGYGAYVNAKEARAGKAKSAPTRKS